MNIYTCICLILFLVGFCFHQMGEIVGAIPKISKNRQGMISTKFEVNKIKKEVYCLGPDPIPEEQDPESGVQRTKLPIQCSTKDKVRSYESKNQTCCLGGPRRH